MVRWQRQFIRYLFCYSSKRMRIEAAFVVKHPHVPKHLYKFRTFSPQHLDALSKGVLWMSSPDRFNDPFDTTVYFDPDRFFMEDLPLQEFLEKVKKLDEARTRGEPFVPSPFTHPVPTKEWRERRRAEILANEPADRRDKLLAVTDQIMQTIAAQLRQQMTQYFRNNFSVLSLAGNPTAVLMWSHYSDSHRGFCIDYDFGSLPPDDLRRRLCSPVFYRGKRTDATRYMAKRDPMDFNNLFGQYQCLLKERQWSYEQEWRIVHAIGAPLANREFVMPMPSAIILGSQVRPDDERRMREFCDRKKITLKRAVEIDGQLQLLIRDV
jgi:Protein of unknown function (DUF2971)